MYKVTVIKKMLYFVCQRHVMSTFVLDIFQKIGLYYEQNPQRDKFKLHRFYLNGIKTVQRRLLIRYLVVHKYHIKYHIK